MNLGESKQAMNPLGVDGIEYVEYATRSRSRLVPRWSVWGLLRRCVIVHARLCFIVLAE